MFPHGMVLGTQKQHVLLARCSSCTLANSVTVLQSSFVYNILYFLWVVKWCGWSLWGS